MQALKELSESIFKFCQTEINKIDGNISLNHSGNVKEIESNLKILLKRIDFELLDALSSNSFSAHLKKMSLTDIDDISENGAFLNYEDILNNIIKNTCSYASMMSEKSKSNIDKYVKNSNFGYAFFPKTILFTYKKKCSILSEFISYIKGIVNDEVQREYLGLNNQNPKLGEFFELVTKFKPKDGQRDYSSELSSLMETRRA